VSDRNEILQAFRTWLKAWSSATPLTDDQVIPADDNGPRPALPYLTVKVILWGTQRGTPEVTLTWDDPNLNAQTRTQRTGTVNVQGFGPTAHEWLETAKDTLFLPDVVVLFGTAGLSVWEEEGIQDLSRAIDTGIEQRYSQDFRIAYGKVSGDYPAVPALIVRVEQTDPSAEPELDRTYDIEV